MGNIYLGTNPVGKIYLGSTLILDNTGGGSGGGGGSGYVLTDYPGAFVAASTKKISNTYNGQCLKVRRGTDNATQDIGFSGDLLDTGALLSFVGSSSGFIDTIYDQSGNARNITQPTTTEQPAIVDTGTLITNSLGQPAIRFTNHHIRWLGSLRVDLNYLFVGLQVTGYIQNAGITAIIPEIGYYDWADKTADSLATRNNGFAGLYANNFYSNGLADSVEIVANTSGTVRQKISWYKKTGIAGLRWPSGFVTDTFTNSGPWIGAGLGIGKRYDPTQAGFNPSSGNSGDFLLDTIVCYDSDQSANEQAIYDLI